MGEQGLELEELMAKKGQRSEVGRSWRKPSTAQKVKFWRERGEHLKVAVALRRSLAAKKGAETRKAKIRAAVQAERERADQRELDALGPRDGGQIGQMDPSSPQTLLGQTLIDPARLAQLERDSRELEGRREEERVERAERLARAAEKLPAPGTVGIIARCWAELQCPTTKGMETFACTLAHGHPGEHNWPAREPYLKAARDRWEAEARAFRMLQEKVPEGPGVRASLVEDEERFWDQEKAGVDALQEEHGLKGCLTPGAKADRIAAGYGMGAEKRAELRTRMEEAEAPAGLKPALGQFFPPGWELRKDGFGWKGGAQAGETPRGGALPPEPVNLHGIKRSNIFDKVEHEDERAEHRLLERLDLQEKALQTLLEATHLLIEKLSPLLPDGWMPTPIPEGPQLKESSMLVLQVDRVANRLWVLNNQLRELRVALQL